MLKHMQRNLVTWSNQIKPNHISFWLIMKKSKIIRRTYFILLPPTSELENGTGPSFIVFPLNKKVNIWQTLKNQLDALLFRRFSLCMLWIFRNNAICNLIGFNQIQVLTSQKCIKKMPGHAFWNFLLCFRRKKCSESSFAIGEILIELQKNEDKNLQISD